MSQIATEAHNVWMEKGGNEQVRCQLGPTSKYHLFVGSDGNNQLKFTIKLMFENKNRAGKNSTNKIRYLLEYIPYFSLGEWITPNKGCCLSADQFEMMCAQFEHVHEAIKFMQEHI